MKKTLIASASLLALCVAVSAAAEGPGGPDAAPGGGGYGGMSTDGGSSTGGSMSSPATTSGAAMGEKKINHQDRKFIKDAAEAGMAEVRLGQLAADHSKNQSVRDFGSTMVRDHTPANQRLMSIASALSVTPSDKLGFMHRHMEKKMSKGQDMDNDMDEDYLEGEVKDHKKMAALMEDEARNGENADLKQFASDILPKVREHQAMAESLLDHVRKNK